MRKTHSERSNGKLTPRRLAHILETQILLRIPNYLFVVETSSFVQLTSSNGKGCLPRTVSTRSTVSATPSERPAAAAASAASSTARPRSQEFGTSLSVVRFAHTEELVRTYEKPMLKTLPSKLKGGVLERRHRDSSNFRTRRLYDFFQYSLM